MVVEELLELLKCIKSFMLLQSCMPLVYLIHKIYAYLLETIVFKYLKSSDIEHSTKVYFLHLRINECFIALLNEPLEEPVIDCPGDAASRICCLQVCPINNRA